MSAGTLQSRSTPCSKRGILPRCRLSRAVLVGTDRGTGRDALSALAAGAGAPEAVVRIGRVDEPVLRALYRRATAFVYPSRYEETIRNPNPSTGTYRRLVP